MTSEPSSAPVTVLTPRRAIAFNWIALAIVLCLGYALELTAALRGTWSYKLGLDVFRLDSEGNVPSLYSAGMMVAIAVLMFRTSSRERGLRLWTAALWNVLGCIFIYLAFDELLALHEHFIDARFLPKFDSLFHFRWVVLGIGLIVIVFGVFLPFLLKLPRITAARLFIAGAVYVLGALVMEMVGGYVFETYGPETAIYSISTIIEETIEDIGLMLALRTMLLHLGEVLPPRSPQP